ncbi:MAG TPA: GIY-YIG nuclease family protein [Ktedonobacterales bacterium]|jgi:hypothetical protein
MSERPQSGGIYVIANTITGDIYIGSSIDLSNRMSQHRALLNAGRHPNTKLQADWDEFGGSAFLFDILEVVHDHSQLVAVEQRYLDERKPQYNQAWIATNAAAGVGHQTRMREKRERAEQIRELAAGESLRFYERINRYDDVGNILLTLQDLSLSGLLAVFAHRDLALAAYRSGVLTARDFLQFLDSGYRGLYQETQQQIREHGGLKRGQDISDYMGSLETAANIFRAALARQMMDDRGVSDLPRANATHYEAGDSVRTLLLSKGIVPEQLPTPRKSFQQLLREEEARQRILAEDRLGLWGDAEETE